MGLRGLRGASRTGGFSGAVGAGAGAAASAATFTATAAGLGPPRPVPTIARGGTAAPRCGNGRGACFTATAAASRRGGVTCSTSAARGRIVRHAQMGTRISWCGVDVAPSRRADSALTRGRVNGAEERVFEYKVFKTNVVDLTFVKETFLAVQALITGLVSRFRGRAARSRSAWRDAARWRGPRPRWPAKGRARRARKAARCIGAREGSAMNLLPLKAREPTGP